MKINLETISVLLGAFAIVSGCNDVRTKNDDFEVSHYSQDSTSITDLSVGDQYDMSSDSLQQTLSELELLSSYLEKRGSQKISQSTTIEIFGGGCNSGEAEVISTFSQYSDFFRKCAEERRTSTTNRWMPIGIFLSGEVNSSSTKFLEFAYAVAASADRAPYDWGFPAPSYSLYIESGGGEIDSALEAGEIVWNLFDSVNVVNSGCSSACVFYLAAAKEKRFLSEVPWRRRGPPKFDPNALQINKLVGIHSPIPITDSKVSAKELNAVRKHVNDNAVEFVSKYGVSPRLVELMMAVPSGEIRYLSATELEELGLWGESVVAKDLERVEMLQKCGADFEVRRKEFFSEVEKSCPSSKVDLKGSLSCWDQTAVRMQVTTEFCDEFGIGLWSEIGSEKVE